MRGLQIIITGRYVFEENEYFIGVENVDELKKEQNNQKPFFARIKKEEESITCSTDLVRSYPIFYTTSPYLIISDSVEEILKMVGKSNFTLSPESKDSFLQGGFTTGTSTLFNEIKQVPAGTKLTLSLQGDVISCEETYSYAHETSQDLNYPYWEEAHHEMLLGVFSKMVQHIDSRQIVVPLSGGKDSRLIVLILKELGVKNVVCFSYGTLNSVDAKISKSVASQLGYEWIFIDYTLEKWRDLYQSDEKENYFSRAFNYSSLPHIQDWLAVKEIKDRNLVDQDAFFVPGHSADLPAGSFSIKYPAIYKEDKFNKNEVTQVLQKVLFSLNDPSSQSRESIESQIRHQLHGHYCDQSDAFDSFFVKEKISKFIVNSMRVYETFGYNWWLPFWDPEFWNFWLKVPKEYVFDQKLYKSSLESIAKKQGLKVLDTYKETKRWYKPASVKKILKEWANATGLKSQYHQHSMKWYGIMSKEYFNKIYKGNMHINSFLSSLILKEVEDEFEISTKQSKENYK